MISAVSVFCASSSKIDPVYFLAAEKLGVLLAEHHIAVYYGGGEIGLMGKLADTILQHNGNITGVIPAFMVQQGWAHPKVEQMVVHDMHERKKTLTRLAEAIIVLPGGVGTIEELLEVITLKQLGKVLVPIILVNTSGFFDPLLDFFDRLIRQKFMREVHRDIWSVISDPENVLDAINNAPLWDGSKIKYAPA